MGNIGRAVGVLLVLAAGTTTVAAQEGAMGAQEAYFGAVAEFFQLPRSEVGILGEWRLGGDEIPVVLFVARKAGVSPEAVVALRRSGRGWADLAERYRLDATQFHVPLPAQADAGVLAGAYAQYRSTLIDRWSEVTLTDADIVALVNLRVLSQTLRMPPESILQRAGGGSWHELYLSLIRDADEGSGEGAAE